MKVFDGGDTKRLVTVCKGFYENVRYVRPEASRKESSELFLVCLNYKGDGLTMETELNCDNINKSSQSANS